LINPEEGNSIYLVMVHTRYIFHVLKNTCIVDYLLTAVFAVAF